MGLSEGGTNFQEHRDRGLEALVAGWVEEAR